MMVLNQKGDKIYNTDFLQEITCYKDYTYDEDRIPIIRITAQYKDSRVFLGEYVDIECGNAVLMDLMDAIILCKNGFKMPIEWY